MSDSLGKISGTPWHVGFVHMDSDDHKRDKRLCIHYGGNNTCKGKFKSCIGSSHCDFYKEKPKSAEHKTTNKPIHNKPVKPKELVSIECSIPLGESIETSDGNYGFLVKYKNKTMTILINGNECKYVYPYAFQDGYLKMTPEIEKCISNDLRKAVWK